MTPKALEGITVVALEQAVAAPSQQAASPMRAPGSLNWSAPRVTSQDIMTSMQKAAAVISSG